LEAKTCGSNGLSQPDANRNAINTKTSDVAHSTGSQSGNAFQPPPFLQFLFIGFLAVYILNLGYGFDGTGTQLKRFDFVSMALSGEKQPLTEGGRYSGNRFRHCWIGELSIPLPKQYVLGADSQKRDLEEFHMESYLRGEWKKGGWWYYYAYGLFVKVPCGIVLLFALTLIARCLYPPNLNSIRNEVVLVLPAAAILILVSSHTAFNIHLRYVFPSLGLGLVFAGGAVSFWGGRNIAATVLLYFVFSELVIDSVSHVPHQISYFNHFVGGTRSGPQHLLGSSFDWGQDLMRIAAFLNREYPSTPVIWECPNDRLGDLLCRRQHGIGRNIVIRVIQADRYFASSQGRRFGPMVTDSRFVSRVLIDVVSESK
jgi:hypothetical protein